MYLNTIMHILFKKNKSYADSAVSESITEHILN